MLVAKHHTRQRLDLDILHARPLDLREVTHLSLGEFDIVKILGR